MNAWLKRHDGQYSQENIKVQSFEVSKEHIEEFDIGTEGKYNKLNKKRGGGGGGCPKKPK